MKLLKFFAIGMAFGVVLIKAEAVSWFRIQEMFHFQSIHMYGIMGCAVGVGAITVALIKRFNLKSFAGEPLALRLKPFNKVGNLLGGILFGVGWALTGACPGPLYALLGAGYATILVPITTALLGVIAYGHLKSRLPH